MKKHDTLLLSCGTAEERSLLRSIFDERFYMLEAVSVEQTELLLGQNRGCVAAVLLILPRKNCAALLEQECIAAMMRQIPVIAITTDESPEVVHVAFSAGVSDVIPLHYEGFAMLKRVQTIVHLSLYMHHLETLAEEQARVLQGANETMIDALSSIIEYRSVESGQHILRIRRFTKTLLEEVQRICPEYQLTEDMIANIASASALHDIGKIAIPDAILMKPGKLTAEEWDVMKSHALTGSRILESLQNIGNHEYLRYAHNISHYHHERWDGRGYPEGLSGEDIPICAQVVGLCDAYDALTSPRVYKNAYSHSTAMNMILNGECGAFSEKLLECFKHVGHRFEQLAEAYRDGLSPKNESFDVTLPGVSPHELPDEMEDFQTKYRSLLHVFNAFILEVDVRHGVYHVLYNPYPELAALRGVSTLEAVERLFVEEIVAPEEKERMRDILQRELPNFLEQGLRRQAWELYFRSWDKIGRTAYTFTLLRPISTQQRVLFLIQKQDEAATVPAMHRDAEPAFSENPFLTLFDSAYCCKNDRYFTLIRAVSKMSRFAGYTLDELESQFDNRLIHLVVPEDRERLYHEFSKQLVAGNYAEAEFRIRHKNGEILWVLNRSRLMMGENGEEQLFSILINITAGKRSVDALREKLDRYETIFSRTQHVLFDWDAENDRITFSDAWYPIFGYQPAEEQFLESITLQSHFHPDDIGPVYRQMKALRDGEQDLTFEARIVLSSGRYCWFRVFASAFRDRTGKLLRVGGIMVNIDEQKETEKALLDRAEQDSLTKLLNNQAARKHTEAYLNRHGKEAHCALLIIDLDDFKQFNDLHGHMFGDTVLIQASKELRKLFRTQDVLARIGGDELLVAMCGVSDRDLVERRCRQLIELFRNCFREQGYDLQLSCSIGIALAPEHGTTYDELFRCADAAVYQSKHHGKNQYIFYHAEQTAIQDLPSSIGTSIDSNDKPGLTSINMVRNAFQQLYASDHVAESIQELLRIVGQQTNVSRVYVFENSDDDRYCHNTFEWCNDGIPPEIDVLQNISYEEDIPGYQENFNEDGIFYCPDVTTLSKKTYDILAPQGIKSMLQCAILDGGRFRGYIGFDECTTQRYWTREQIDTLTYFAGMLSVFLQKYRAQEKTARYAKNLTTVLDNQTAGIYIIDPDTCEIQYVNARARLVSPNAKVGTICYRTVRGFDTRCEGCPARRIQIKGTDRVVFDQHPLGNEVLAEAAYIQWDGKPACMITCRKANF